MIILIMIAVVLLQNNQSRSLCNWTDNLIKFFTIDKFCTRNLQSIWHAAYLSFLFSIALVDLKANSNCCLSCLFFLSSLEITLIRLLTNRHACNVHKNYGYMLWVLEKIGSLSLIGLMVKKWGMTVFI